MSTPPYRSARAMIPPARVRWEDFLIPEPLPIPADHPELDLWGITRVRRENEAEDAGALARGRLKESDPTPSALRPQPAEPEPLRARMLNEFVYCQRLFYYEFVDRVFVETAATDPGSALHEKVDRGGGDLPKANRMIAFSPVTGLLGSVPCHPPSGLSPAPLKW